jgi:hypothetical protein
MINKIEMIEDGQLYSIKYLDILFLALDIHKDARYIIDFICNKYNGKFDFYADKIIFINEENAEGAKEELESYLVLHKLIGDI